MQGALQIMKTEGGAVSLVRYIGKYGFRVVEYAKVHGEPGLQLFPKVGKWVGSAARPFPDSKVHFDKHWQTTGEKWFGKEGQWFKDELEYIHEARELIKNPSSKKVLYYHESNPNKPRLGYLLEKGGKLFLAAVDDAGNIVTFHFRDKGWAEIVEGVTFNKLFKVDSF